MDLEEFLASVPELSPEVDSWGEARRIYVTAADFALPIARLTVNEGGRTIYPLIYPIAKGLIQSGAEDLPALFYAQCH